MTLFLASVRGAEEAEVALAQGADIIDLKDPSQGALGAVTLDAVREALTRIAGRRPVSAVAGDLPMEPARLRSAVTALAETGVDYVKVGLFPGLKRAECISALAEAARRTRIIGVMFADHGADDDLVPLMAQAGFVGAMLDTARKGGGRLLDHKDIAQLDAFVSTCRANGLMAGLAGSLEAPDVPRLLLLKPDVLGFRRALCSGSDRAGAIDAEAVSVIRELIPLDVRSAAAQDPSARKVDYRLLAARGYSVDPAKATDHVFVRDFVLPVRIGAYAHERDRAQRVRFDVDARVLRSNHPVHDMRDVFSYDVITDGIRMIVAHEHVPLIEMLAEKVAAFVLGNERVTAVTVRVEKLDVGPGSVGVEITREKPAEIAKVHHLYPTAAGDAHAKAAE